MVGKFYPIENIEYSVQVFSQSQNFHFSEQEKPNALNRLKDSVNSFSQNQNLAGWQPVVSRL